MRGRTPARKLPSRCGLFERRLARRAQASEGRLPGDRQPQAAWLVGRHHPTARPEPVQDRRAKRACDVRSPLGPVETLPGERTAPGVRSQRRDIDVVDGFISVVRYRRLSDPNTLLSLSTWRDDEAVARWRARTSHRVAQQEGRSSLFADYRLRIAAVVRDYGMFRREQAPIV